MYNKQNPKLFFIISPKYKLGAVENFLKKRDYLVYSESDVKAGLLQLIEIQPDFVFIALDHPNPKVALLPQIIEQCIETNVIPFTHAGGKNEIKKLDESTLIHKIYPPLSGPAVERMTLKILSTGFEVQKKSKSSSSAEGAVKTFIDQLSEKKSAKPDDTSCPKAHLQRLKNKNNFFANAKTSMITSGQKINLQNDFKKRFESELTDILETCASTDSSNVVSFHGQENDEEKKKIYCLLVESEIWSGHLMAHSNVNLESHLLEPVFKNWVSQEFRYFNENESHLFFEMEINMSDFKKWVQNKAEHFETLKVNDSELMMSFVGIEPAQLLMDFNEETDLIKVNLDLIPIDQELHFSLFLHLPENKKFLLYTPAHQPFKQNQKQRLIDNRVETLYTPIEFEDEVKKLKMKKYIDQTLDQVRNETE